MILMGLLRELSQSRLCIIRHVANGRRKRSEEKADCRWLTAGIGIHWVLLINLPIKISHRCRWDMPEPDVLFHNDTVFDQAALLYKF